MTINHTEVKLAQKDTFTGIAVALAATAIINLPLWHGVLFEGELNKPDIVGESSDEEFYLTRIREVADGHGSLGHPYVHERADQRYPLGNLWETFIGLKMKWLNLNIKTVSTAADGVFPFVLALLIWLATKPVLPLWRWRALLVSMLFLGFEMAWWKRPVSPQATTVLPLLWLWAAFSPARGSVPLTIARGALIGIMTLSYPFHWTYCLAAEGLLTLRLLWTDETVARRFKRILCVALPFLLAATPWIVLMLSMHGDPAYTETLSRLGLIERRFPAGLPLQAMIIAVGMLTFFARRKATDTRIADTLLILLGAGLVVLNQTLITGQEGEFSSHYRQIIAFPLCIAFLWSVSTLLRGWRRLLIVLPIAGFVIVGVRTNEALIEQWQTYETHRADPARAERMAAMDALNTLPGQQVVLTDDATGRNLTVYTQHYPFFVFETHMYLISDAEVRERGAVQQTLFPDHVYSRRAIIGSRELNAALHAKTICKLHTIFNMPSSACDERITDAGWVAFEAMKPTEEDMLAILKNAGVTYVFMKNIPAWLETHMTDIRDEGDYRLGRLALD